MDSGHLEEGETLEEEYDVMRALQPKEVIGIMDQLLCLEVRKIQLYRRRSMMTRSCTGCLAHGLSSFADPFHVNLHQSLTLARACESGKSTVLQK